MEKEILKEPQFTDEIVSIIRSGLSGTGLAGAL